MGRAVNRQMSNGAFRKSLREETPRPGRTRSLDALPASDIGANVKHLRAGRINDNSVRRDIYHSGRHRLMPGSAVVIIDVTHSSASQSCVEASGSGVFNRKRGENV